MNHTAAQNQRPNHVFLEQRADNSHRRSLEPLSDGVVFLPLRQVVVQSGVTHIAEDVHVLDLEEPDTALQLGVLVQVAVDTPADHESDDDGQGEVVLEEDHGAHGGNGDVEGGHETQEDEEEADGTADDAERRGEGQLLDVAAVVLPGLTETDVCETDAAPDEEVGDTGQSQQPGEDGLALRGLVYEGQEGERDLQGDTPDRTALLVDVCEELGGHLVLCQSLDGTAGSVGGRVGDTEHGEGDDGVHDGGQAADTGLLDRDDEGGGLGVGAGRTEQELGVAGDDEADDEGSQNVEDHDTPEHLLGGLGDGLGRVGGLSSGQTAQLGTGKGKGAGDEDGAEALEGGEGARVTPVLGADVSALWRTTAVDHDAEDDEADERGDLDQGEDEFD